MILSKLRGQYQIFSSTFYSTMDSLGDRHRMPIFETFCDRLTREHAKIQQVDATGSFSQALVAQNSKGKSKKKGKAKKDTSKFDPNPPPPPPANPSKGKDSSKSGESTSKTKKKSSENCSFYGKDGHSVSRCWK